MRKFLKMLPLIVLMALAQNVMGQPLSGTYSIGASGIVSGEVANYATLSAAVTALNTNGVNGPCTFYFSESKTYTEAADVAIGYTGGSSTNTVTFKPYTGIVCIVSFSSNATRTIDGTLVIGAADASATLPGSLISTNYLTFDGSNTLGGTTKDLTISNTGVTVQKSLIRIFGNSDNITIKNCTLISSTTSASTNAAINITNYFSTPTNYNPDNITIHNNIITANNGTASSGIHSANSGSPTVGANGLTIRDNVINGNLRGIFVSYTNGGDIYNNTISLVSTGTTTNVTAYGITVQTNFTTGTFNIYNNNLINLTTNTTSVAGASNGIIGIDNQCVTPKIVNIYNNVIRGFATAGAANNAKIYGIRNTSTSTTTIYNNSIYLPELNNMVSSNNIAGIAFATAAAPELSPSAAANCTVKNNTIFIDESTMKVWAIRRVGNTGTFTSDNNNVYINTTNASGYIGYFNTADAQTLANWQTASSQDANSYNLNPNFISTTDLTPTLGGYFSGTNTLYSTTDINGVTRSTTKPHIGAYESTAKHWLGTTNDWSTASNWRDNILPTSGDNVIIGYGSTNTSLPSNTTITNIGLQTGTALGIGSNTFTINGTITGTGTLTGSSSSSLVIGGAAGTLNFSSGSRIVKDLTLNTGSSLTLGTALDITAGASSGTLTVASSATLNTAGLLTLKSDGSGTARIGSSAGLINGNITQERYISSKSSRAWSLISSPVGQALSAGWQQQIHITGANTGTTACTTDATTGFDVTTTNAPSAYTYDASLTAGSRWVVVPNTLSTNTAAGKGFRLNIRGPRSAGCVLLDGSSLIPTAVTLSSTGTISNADKNLGSFSIIYPNAASGDNYVLAGNPYPSQISFSALRAANAAALDNTYAIYAPGNTAGNYAYWDPTGGTFAGGNNGLNNATGDIIANGQAVFLKGSAAGNVTINFAENQKTATTQNGYFRTRSFNEMIRIAYMLDDTNKADEIIVRYANDNEASNTKVGAMDIVSMNAGSQYLNSLKGNKAMAVQTRSLQTLTTDTVALNVKSSQSGTYKLNFSEYENFGATIYLIDSYTKTIHDVKASATYSFTIDKNNAATQTNRFALVFSKAIAPTVITGIKVYPNPADKQITVQLPTTTDKYTVSISDIAGKKVYQSQLSSGTQSINIAKFTKGNYVIEITDAKGNRAVEKLVKQ